MSLVCFSMAPSSAEAGLCYVCDGSARWLTARDNGIVCPPSVPAQLEVINTGNLIQRQETPLPPKEFKLNALLFFLAKSRFAGLSIMSLMWPGQVDISGGYSIFFFFFGQSLNPSLTDHHNFNLTAAAALWLGLSFSIIPKASPIQYSYYTNRTWAFSLVWNIYGKFILSVFFLFFFFYCYSCANTPHRFPSPCPCSNGNVNMGK